MEDGITNPDILIRFGERVRALRRAKKLSQDDLAAACGLNRTYVSEVENGKRNVSLRNIEAIAKAIGVTLEKLFEGIK